VTYPPAGQPGADPYGPGGGAYPPQSGPPAQDPYGAPASAPPASGPPQGYGAPYSAPPSTGTFTGGYGAPASGPPGYGPGYPAPDSGPAYGAPAGGYPPPTGVFPGQPDATGYSPQYPPPGFPGPASGPPGGPMQPWGAPGAPMPTGGSRNTTPLIIIGVVAAVVVLVLAGGLFAVFSVMGDDDQPRATSGEQAPPAAATAAPGLPTARPTQSSAAAGSGVKYGKPGDLCSVDLAALGPYSAKKEKATPNIRTVGSIERSDCDFELRTAAGMKVTLRVQSQVYSSAKEAQNYYKAGYDIDKSRYFDADLTGLGDQAHGTNRDWDIGSKTSDYTVRLVDGNLYLTVNLVTFGQSFVPKDEIKPKAVDQTKAVLAKLPKA
jgi:hypothetical protein